MLSVVLLLILLLHFLPSLIIDYLATDFQWQFWHICLLSIIVLQSFAFFRKDSKFINLMGGLILLLNIYFLTDYIVDMDKVRYTESDYYKVGCCE